MNKLHADWKQSVQKELKRRRRGGQEVEEYERKKRVKWSAEEDAELLDQVDCCGEGEWTKILKNSKILQNRYKSSHSKNHALESLRNHYNNITKDDSNKSTSVKLNDCKNQSYQAGKIPSRNLGSLNIVLYVHFS
ncbi:hypothetical protein ACHAXS_002791 [Conticribra weissflogii]